MPEKTLSSTGEIIQAAFEAIHLGRGNAYTEHPNDPIIKKYLEETTLDPLSCSIKKTAKRRLKRTNFSN